MEEIIRQVEKAPASWAKIVLSAAAKKGPALPEKISLEQVRQKEGEAVFFAREFVEKKVLQKPVALRELSAYLSEMLSLCAFRQVNLFCEESEIAFRISKKGKVTQSVNRKAAPIVPKEAHNREKNYLVREGDRVPFLVDLGVFTRDYRIVAQKQDKFRQINRFIEILDHAFRDWDKEEISVLDFGCGKSYLTFFVYYYFAVLRKKRVHIIGYDLKRDVVEHCNELAKRYGYHGLQFVVADVTRDALTEERIDFVISLHACDVATDYALQFALEHDVPYIFSVPCCQHEVNGAIRKGDGELDLFLEHGLLKERMSALLTDAFRTRILESEGYRVDVLEFVDFAHSPKNLMLRAKKKKEGGKKKSLAPLLEMEARYGFRQTLLHLRTKENADG
ncbi:MAG: SAM-dependent methyltransferase [Clostridia bacterium]|nr:SAM-dependent methyltransferase [Clostridia bacterium]